MKIPPLRRTCRVYTEIRYTNAQQYLLKKINENIIQSVGEIDQNL